MKNLFNDISNEERRRILEMHERATKRNYLMEAPTGDTPTQTGTQTAGATTQTGGVTPPSTNPDDKVQRLKTNPELRKELSYVPISDIIRYFNIKIIMDREEHNSDYELGKRMQSVLRAMLDFYYRQGINPTKSKLDGNIAYIDRFATKQGYLHWSGKPANFMDDYNSLTGGGDYGSARFKPDTFAKIFTNIYNDKLASI